MSFPWPFFCALKVWFGSQKVPQLSAQPKRSCYIAVTLKTVNTCWQLWWRKEKSRRKGKCIAWPECQMMLATRIIHLYMYFCTLLSEGCSSMAKMDMSRLSTSRRFYSSMSSALCSMQALKMPVMNTYH